jgi:hypothetical protein
VRGGDELRRTVVTWGRGDQEAAVPPVGLSHAARACLWICKTTEGQVLPGLRHGPTRQRE